MRTKKNIFKTCNLIIVIFCVLIFQVNAQNIKFLDGLPSSTTVLSEIKGSNPLETRAKQWAAFSAYRNMILNMSGKRRFLKEGGLTNQEQALINTYDVNQKKIYNEIESLSKDEQTTFRTLSSVIYKDDPSFISLLSVNANKEYNNYKNTNDSITKSKGSEYTTQRKRFEEDSEKGRISAQADFIKLIIIISVLLVALILLIITFIRFKNESKNIFIDYDGSKYRPCFGVKEFILEDSYGEVITKDKQLETVIEGSGGSGFIYKGSGNISPVTISSKTIVRDYITMSDSTNNKTPIKLVGFDVICNPDDRLAIFKGTVSSTFKNFSDYIGIYNYSTNTLYTGQQQNQLFFQTANNKVNKRNFLFLWVSIFIFIIAGIYVPTLFIFLIIPLAIIYFQTKKRGANLEIKMFNEHLIQLAQSKIVK